MTGSNDNNPELIGHCINCERGLFVGGKGLRYEDGPIACEACAPTFAEASEGWKAQAGSDQQGFADFTRIMQSHIAAGGSVNDKFVQTL